MNEERYAHIDVEAIKIPEPTPIEDVPELELRRYLRDAILMMSANDNGDEE